MTYVYSMDEKILNKLQRGLVFLSMPYSSDDLNITQERYESALRLINHLMTQGVHVVSPIITGHPVVSRFNTPADWEYWAQYCEKCIDACETVLVYQLKGFDSSVGVEGELRISRELHKEVLYVDEDFNFIETLLEDGVPESINYGKFPINDLRVEYLKLWGQLFEITNDIDLVKSLMQGSTDAIQLRKKLIE